MAVRAGSDLGVVGLGAVGNLAANGPLGWWFSLWKTNKKIWPILFSPIEPTHNKIKKHAFSVHRQNTPCLTIIFLALSLHQKNDNHCATPQLRQKVSIVFCKWHASTNHTPQNQLKLHKSKKKQTNSADISWFLSKKDEMTQFSAFLSLMATAK